jgi:hypothetical protein
LARCSTSHAGAAGPRVIALIGAPSLLVSTLGTLLNLWGQVSWSALLALPVAVFEFSLGVYLTVKGFRPSPITSANALSEAAS